MNSDISIFGKDSKMSIGDFIDHHLDLDEQYIAEALGKLFYDRSLEEFNKMDMHDKGLIPYRDMNPWDKHDPSRYGLDFYKMLGYQMVLKCKSTSEAFDANGSNGAHPWKKFLVIMFGKDVDYILKNPRAYGFA